MTILTLRTDTSDAELSMYADAEQLDHAVWQAHRELSQTLHTKIEAMLACHQKTIHDVQGIVCFTGPGSFTGLRIGLSVANALGYSLGVSIVGMTGEDWEKAGVTAILEGKNDRIAVPAYGMPAHTTLQKH